MEIINKYKNIVVNLIKLSLPILGGNLAQILINIADTAIAGRYSTVALGAVSVASAIVMTITIGAIGLILSVSPVISNFRGQAIPAKKYFKLTLLFSILISIPFFLILELFLWKIDLIGMSNELVQPVKDYIFVCAWSIFPTAIFVAIKEFLQAYEKVFLPNFLMFVMVILNVFLNIVFAFGYDFGQIVIPELGVFGLALATLISKTVVAIIILMYCLPLFKSKFEISKKYLKDLFKVGTPISAAIFFEFLGFNLTAVLIGKFSALFAAVHNIVLCLANFSFMICLSISNATSIKVGFFNGKKDIENIIRYSKVNVFLIVLVCISTFILFGLFANEIIGIFTNDVEVIKLCKNILKIVMCFLLFDGLQCACVGILKGLKDTKIIMASMLFGYLLIAIPIGCYFAFYKNIVLVGFWCGLALALFSVSIITGVRVLYNIKKLKCHIK